MTPEHGRDEMLEIYEEHPLREATILERIRAQRGGLEGIDEIDLATDEEGEITDQNHVGGLALTWELARRCGVGAATRVLDVGTGLGGTARALAHRYGCRVVGVDLSPPRCAGAESLNRRVGLDSLVRVVCGDFLTVELPPRAFDLVISQSCFVHFPDPALLLERCAELLAPGGRVAFEDSVLGPAPAAARQAELEELEACWQAHLLPREAWREALAAAGFSLEVEDDLTAGSLAYFRQWVRRADRHPGRFPDVEVRAWRLAVELGDAGIVSYLRMIGALPG